MIIKKKRNIHDFINDIKKNKSIASNSSSKNQNSTPNLSLSSNKLNLVQKLNKRIREKEKFSYFTPKNRNTKVVNEYDFSKAVEETKD